jgi:hypothetical protein
MTKRQFTTGCLALALWTTWAITRVTAGLALVRPEEVSQKTGPLKSEAFAFFAENFESKENQRP